MDLRLPPPAWALLLGWLLIGRARSEGACLQDGAHKATPSAEPQLGECSLYADSESAAASICRFSTGGSPPQSGSQAPAAAASRAALS